MQYSGLALLFAALASAAPFKFPLPNGFPNPSPASLKTIEKNAGGTLPNGALPSQLSATDKLDLEVAASQEIFEVAYFTSLFRNISNNVPGYSCNDWSHGELEEIFFNIRAQEELHALGVNAILEGAGAKAIEPCEYVFGVTSLSEAIALADTFTDLVLGTLQAVQADFIAGGEQGPLAVPLVSSIAEQEGEQVGFFRLFGGKTPSSAPFLTGAAGQFAWSALNQNFIVPGSCPNPPDIPIFDALTPLTHPGDSNTTVSYSTKAPVTEANYVAYISGQNLPVVVPVSDIKKSASGYTFSAEFPFGAGFSKGLTIAALTKGKGPFASAAAVAADTLAGPGLIEVD